MQCTHLDLARCRSCDSMGLPYEDQITSLVAEVTHRLDGLVPAGAWETPFVGPESGFRNKAKLAVGGTKAEPTFGILDAELHGVDLRDCGLYEPALAAALPPLTAAVVELGLVPFDVRARSGELKHLIVTASPDGELMLRFVLRSPGQLPRIRRGLGSLRSVVDRLRVVSVNIQPEHKAVLEGDEEIVLTDADTLPMRLDDVTLGLRPRSFFQTNSVVAAGLYQQARRWVADSDPAAVLDLYCGVGGFALNAALAKGRSDRRVEGVEISADAVTSARTTAEQLGIPATFRVGDARAVAEVDADLLVVNPPRRGIGRDLCDAVTVATPDHLVYSSCNSTTLARDLADLPGHHVVGARLFDMFPQTRHHEIIVLLERR